MNQDLTTALYEAMAKEQANFRDWLVKQPPEEILNHTYEYTVREDILMAMEELELPREQGRRSCPPPRRLRMCTGIFPIWKPDIWT